MDKRLIIGVGIVILLLAVGLWGYLLLFGTPTTEPEETFTDLNPERLPPNNPQPIPQDPNAPQDLALDAGLQQLTTRAVAGFRYITSSTTEALRYVEQGTGHLYEINLQNETETRLSNTTIPRVRRAWFGPDGESLVLQSTLDGTPATIFGTLDPSEDALRTYDLPQGMANHFVTNSGTLLYTISEGVRTVGYAYDPETRETEALFTIPLQAIRMLWSADGGTHYVVTRADSHLTGYLYAIRDNQLRQTPVLGSGLTVARGGSDFLFSRHEDDALRSYRYNAQSDATEPLPIYTAPEKCAISEVIYCAGLRLTEHAAGAYTLPESWYKGTVLFRDKLWQIELAADSANPLGSGAALIENISETAGRRIDVTDMAVGDTDAFFRNRADNTLWMYAK